VDTSQNVGIGVTPSAWGSFKAIQLGGSTYNAIASSNSYMAIFGNTYYDGSNFKYVSTAGASTYIQNGGGHYLSSASSGTAGNTVTLTQVLAVGKSSTLALEGATSVSGTGISFPATQSASSNANTLDDYEEGTWTLTVTPGSGSFTVANNTGYYVKIGRCVYINMWWRKTGETSPSGSLSLGGFPFAFASDATDTARQRLWVVGYLYSGLSGRSAMYVVPDGGGSATTGSLFVIDTSYSSGVNLVASNFSGSNTEVYINGFYMTN
jgi:hypothetical protein